MDELSGLPLALLFEEFIDKKKDEDKDTQQEQDPKDQNSNKTAAGAICASRLCHFCLCFTLAVRPRRSAVSGCARSGRW